MVINGFIYLIVGIMVSIVSMKIENFDFFLFVGCIFIFVGVVKIIFSKTKSNHRLGKTATKMVRDVNLFITCNHCQAYNYPHAELCHHCGKEIKKQ